MTRLIRSDLRLERSFFSLAHSAFHAVPMPDELAVA